MLKTAIDFEKLKTFLDRDLAKGRETYEFTWVGKRDAMAEAGKPTTKTLRPDLEESVDFEKSENVFITGDNLEVLKILQESYLGKIDMIYIDPPYNTGKDFVYSDNFQMSEAKLDEELEILDDQGRKKVGLNKNEKSSPRYHSDWLNMMYPRLVLARNLLKESGVIFISIDDNEQANLKAICDEIFGEENFVAEMIIDATPKNDPLMIATSHEYVVVYVKNKDKAKTKSWGFKHPLNEKLNELIKGYSDYRLAEEVLAKFYRKNDLNQDNIRNYKYVDEQGIFRIGPLDDPQGKGPRDNRINIKTGNFLKVPSRGWSCNIKTWNDWNNEGLIYYPDTDDKLAGKKTYLNNSKLEIGRSVIKMQTRKSTNYLKELFGVKNVFTNPKPIDLLKYILNLSTDKCISVLDFFAGSATTADAVMQLNAEDGGNRNYILCTLDEEVAEKSAAKEAGYQTIDQISRERIRRAAQKIQEVHPETIGKLDVGFRAYRLDSSNFKDIGQQPGAFTQENLFDSVSNIKVGRSDFDLLFQIMLTWGMELSLPIVQSEFDGVRVFDVADGSLFACFADEMTESVIRKIAKERPLRAVFKDESFANSAGKINLMQIFKEESPETKVKVV